MTAEVFVNELGDYLLDGPAEGLRDRITNVLAALKYMAAKAEKDRPLFDPTKGLRLASYDIARQLGLTRYIKLKGLE